MDIGTPVAAIEWAIEHEEDHFDRLEFLKAWFDGSITNLREEWSDYFAWLEQRTQ